MTNALETLKQMCREYLDSEEPDADSFCGYAFEAFIEKATDADVEEFCKQLLK